MKSHTVYLEFFCDDANGSYGLAPKETISRHVHNPFNALWSAVGIFHDVFEHWFEHKHKYFLGEYATNVLGEMSAMGAAMYFYYGMGLRERNIGNNSNFMRSVIDQTLDNLREAIGGHCNYGSELLSKIPRQKPVTDYMLNSMLSEYEFLLKTELRDVFDSRDEDERSFGSNYRRSIKAGKIANAHIYGYKLAKSLVPDSQQNLTAIKTFWAFWDKFCKYYEAKELHNAFRYLEVKVTKRKGDIRITSTLIGRYPFEDFKLKYDDVEALRKYLDSLRCPSPRFKTIREMAKANFPNHKF